MNYDYLERVDRHVLMHPQLSQALKTIEKAIISSASSKNPVNVLLTGDAGTGKTTTCQKILSKYPNDAKTVHKDLFTFLLRVEAK